jgi:hypothetical protein
MSNIPLSTSQMEQITTAAALMGVIVNGEHARLDAMGQQVWRQGLVALRREVREQAALAVRKALP